MSKAGARAVIGLAFLLASAAALAAGGAVVTSASGKVLVNTGEEFAPAAEGTQLKPGDRIMAQHGASATVQFDDQCRMQVEQDTIVTIPEKSPCAGGEPLVQTLDPNGGAAIGDAAGATGTSNRGGGLMIAIVAAIDLWWLNEDDSDVASP